MAWDMPSSSSREWESWTRQPGPAEGLLNPRGEGVSGGSKGVPRYLTGDSWHPPQDERQGLPNSREDFRWEFTEEVLSFGS